MFHEGQNNFYSYLLQNDKEIFDLEHFARRVL